MPLVAVTPTHDNFLKPFSFEDLVLVKKFNVGRVYTFPFIRPQDQRSYEQLKLYFSVCREIANNTDHINWNTQGKADNMLRLLGNFVDSRLKANRPCPKCGHQIEHTHIITKSLSYANCSHPDATEYISESMKNAATVLGLEDEEELLKNINQ